MTGVPTDLVDVLPDPLLVRDDGRRILVLNQAATRLTGYARNQLLGQSSFDPLDLHDESGGRVWAQGWPPAAAIRTTRALAEQTVTLRQWISRGLVASHGGDLVAESKLGRGSTFRFTLPLIDLDKLQDS